MHSFCIICNYYIAIQLNADQLLYLHTYTHSLSIYLCLSFSHLTCISLPSVALELALLGDPEILIEWG